MQQDAGGPVYDFKNGVAEIDEAAPRGGYFSGGGVAKCMLDEIGTSYTVSPMSDNFTGVPIECRTFVPAVAMSEGHLGPHNEKSRTCELRDFSPKMLGCLALIF